MRLNGSALDGKRVLERETVEYMSADHVAVVFMAHAPGAVRFYFRHLLHALVLQALE